MTAIRQEVTSRRRTPNKRDLSELEWKIVEAMYRLMADGPRLVTYEDIVVKAWELYPRDFGLRGYSDRYPDAGDLHKPLYKELKASGWVSTGPRRQKKFSLTRLGWERAQARFVDQAAMGEAGLRIARSTQEELRHLERAEAAKLYWSDRPSDILDTDFFAFYRTSVRAPAQEFEGRLSQVGHALEEAVEKNFPGARELREVDEHLRSTFAELIEIKSERKKRGT